MTTVTHTPAPAKHPLLLRVAVFLGLRRCNPGDLCPYCAKEPLCAHEQVFPGKVFCSLDGELIRRSAA